MTRNAVPGRLFYDSGCGPCSFFARAFQGASRARVSIQPLDGPEADRALVDMTASERFEAFHLLVDGRTFTGPDAMAPLVEVTFGPAAARVSRPASPIGRALRRTYLCFWQYRRTHGCAADSAA